MTRVLYTADTHFNHPKVAELRGYSSPEAHDAALLDRLNTFARERDHLWILGDLGMGHLTDILATAAKLRATTHLVWGNHDAGHPMHRKAHTQQRRYLDVFQTVHLHAQHRIGGRRVMLSHVPYSGDHTEEDRLTQWRPRDEGLWLLHGHVHKEWDIRGRQINVGPDAWPAPLDAYELDSLMTAREEAVRASLTS